MRRDHRADSEYPGGITYPYQAWEMPQGPPGKIEDVFREKDMRATSLPLIPYGSVVENG